VQSKDFRIFLYFMLFFESRRLVHNFWLPITQIKYFKQTLGTLARWRALLVKSQTNLFYSILISCHRHFTLTTCDMEITKIMNHFSCCTCNYHSICIFPQNACVTCFFLCELDWALVPKNAVTRVIITRLRMGS